MHGKDLQICFCRAAQETRSDERPSHLLRQIFRTLVADLRQKYFNLAAKRIVPMEGIVSVSPLQHCRSTGCGVICSLAKLVVLPTLYFTEIKPDLFVQLRSVFDDIELRL